jgi:alginate O-acetyltransferase complex protein AlgI
VTLIFVVQTLGPVGLGLLFQCSDIMRAKPLWLGRLLFLWAQMLQIYAFGYGGIAAIGLMVGLFGLFSFFAARPGAGIMRRLATVFFAAYVFYWAFEKYAVPLVILPHAGEGGFFAGAEHLATPIAIVGISYIGFKFIHFFVDYRSGDITRVSPLEFISWLLFFPSIVAGPMQRFEDWHDQFGNRRLTVNEAIWALRRIAYGLILKLVLADNIHNLTLPQLSEPGLIFASWSTIVGSSLLYSLYLYWDFSGYCHIAIGTGVFWGIRLPENFNFPYIARNLAEFWNRWHITLSQILRDYLFYPLNMEVRRWQLLRNHRLVGTIIPPIVTFLLVGLWHGAGIGFIIYGLIQGIGLAYVAVRRGAARPTSDWRKRWDNSKLGYLCAAGFNYCYVSFSFVFFCLPDKKLGILLTRLLGMSLY